MLPGIMLGLAPRVGDGIAFYILFLEDDDGDERLSIVIRTVVRKRYLRQGEEENLGKLAQVQMLS